MSPPAAAAARPPLAHAHSHPHPHPLAQSTLPPHAASSPLAHDARAAAARLPAAPAANGPNGAGPSGLPGLPVPGPAPAPGAPAAGAPAGPRRLEPERADVEAVKRALHDALGAAGLPYWKALNGYLVGQVGRDELVGMVTDWLRADVKLHNRLIASLLSNAHAPSARATSPGGSRKRRRAGQAGAGADAPDVDPDVVEPRARAHAWAMGLGSRERARVRRCLNREDDDEGERDAEKDRAAGPYAQPLLPPLAQSARHLPSAPSLSARLDLVAKPYGLDLAPDAAPELGELAALAVDAHVADILHALVGLTARGRPGVDTVPARAGAGAGAGGGAARTDGADGHGAARADELAGDGPASAAGGSGAGVPRPRLGTLQALFELAPGLHPQASPALYKLGTGYAEAERLAGLGSGGDERGGAAGDDDAAAASRPRDRDALAKVMLDAGLLKVDKAGRDGEDGVGEKKKDKKHGSHWRYEDPAIILRDVLG